MGSRVIQGTFLGGRSAVRTPAAQPAAMPRQPGPPAPAFVAQPRAAQTQGQAPAPGGAVTVDPALLRASGRPGQPLPDSVQRKMEQAFGADFSAVRIHEGPQAESIGAIAFTVGSDIHFAPGRFQPHTAAGQQLLGHELTHVLQQRAGRVRNPLGAGLAVVQDQALEAEADRMGHRAAAQISGVTAAASRSTTSALQRQAGAAPQPLVHSAIQPQTLPATAVAQARGGHPKKRWTTKQHEQSKAFWEKKEKREQRRAESEKAKEAKLLATERAELKQIVDADETYFWKYFLTPKTPKLVYRGDGRGININSLNNLTLSDVLPKPGSKDLSFFGVVEHTHSNSSAGGMVSTTSDKSIAIGFATDAHTYGLVFTMEVDDYIDVNALLAARNFRNRYTKQYEIMTPTTIPKSKIKKVELYQKGVSAPVGSTVFG